MPELIFEKCKNCGAPLNPAHAVNGLLECEFCGSTFTLPKEETESGAIEQLKIASNELDLCRFEGAFSAFQRAAQLDQNEPEACFGMALSEFKVQYLKDNLKHRLQPVCHAVTNKRFSENKHYLRALSLATKEQREDYERRASEIDYIASEFFRLKEQRVRYDCFLCVKVTDDETGMRTADYKYADDIYFSLRGKGYKPFFSERELKNVTGADYEARILYALWCSECMLVVCGKEEYLNTPWVKNEYTRFLALIRDEEKESDSITLAFFNQPIEKLNGKNGRIQGIDLSAMDATERVTAFVEAHTPEAKLRREAEAEKKRAAEAELVKKLEEQQKAQREIEEQLKSLRQNAAVASAPVSAGVNVTSLLVRAKQELDFGDYGAAAKYYGQAIDSDPENGEAWFGAFLCDQKAKNEEELLKDITLEKIKAFRANKNYLFAVKNAAGVLKTNLEKFAETLNDREKFLLAEQAERERQAKEKAERQAAVQEKEAWLRENDPSIDCYDGNEFMIGEHKDGWWLIGKYFGASLKSRIKIPRGVEIMDAEYFSNNLTAQTVEVPASLFKIGDSAFRGCAQLKEVAFPENSNLKSIGAHAFSDCPNLSKFALPESVNIIGPQAFSGCSGLKGNFIIPQGVTIIKRGTFFECTGIEQVTLPDTLTIIYEAAFIGCTNLKNIQIPNCVTYIGLNAFANCRNLTNLTIPNTVTNLENNAFYGCTNLCTVTMPLRFKKRRKKIFKGCKKIKFTYTK